MNVGYVGSSPLAAAAARRLLDAHRVLVLGSDRDRQLEATGAIAAKNLRQLASDSEVVIICAASPTEVRDLLFASEGLAEGLSEGKIVIDQTPGDPLQARAVAADLQKLGVGYVDAPIHCELVTAMPDATAIMCGGPEDTVEAVRPLLEAICPGVVHFGDTGNGHAARLVIGAIAACNRLITYECAATGLQNGLSMADMDTVLNRSSGYNSASARVLPALADGRRTADVLLGAVVEELTIASQLAMRVGAPMLVANLVHGLLKAEWNDLGPSSTLDDTIRILDRAAGTRFASAEASRPGPTPGRFS